MPKLQPKPALETPEERVDALIKSHLVFFWKPYPWQGERLLPMVREKTTTAAISANKIGKTAGAACIVISWALGYEPWNVLEGPDEDSVRIVSQGKEIFYRKSSLGIDPPVNIIITGEDWKLHLGKTIVTELKKWAPEGFYKTTKNEQGVDYFWEWHNKSTFTLMSYTQDVALFESFRAQGAWEDEPPPKDKHTALSRGLLLDNGKTLLTLTPLKEPWILDDIVLSGRKDIGIVDGLMITDNPDLLASDMAVLKDMGLNEEQIQEYMNLLLYDDVEKGKPVTDKGQRAEEYLEEIVDVKRHKDIATLKILKFIKDIDPSDVPPRAFGQFKSLVGRVLKEFEDTIHKIKPFDVPTDWPVVPMIDFHLSTPQAISYWAVDKQDIHYCIGETWKNTDADGIADDIIRNIRGYGWRIEDAYIDPLSKGDTAYMKNELGSDIEDTFTRLQKKLEKERIRLHVASKDKESGIMNIRTWLMGPNRMPTCYLFEDCERHFYEVMRWVYDDKGKPIDENDHFMENWYRYTLTGTVYSKPIDQRGDFRTETDFDPFTGMPVTQQQSLWGTHG
jgi:hypothetical protein